MATIIEGEEEISVRDRSVIKGQKGQNIQNSIRIAVCSELRRRIIIALREGKRALSELRDSLGVSSTTAIHALRELEKENIIFQDESRRYGLTRIGYVIGLKLSDFIDAVEVLKKHEDFWLTHDLSGIPPHLLEKIGWLSNSNVVKIDALDIIKTHTTYIRTLKTAKWIKGVSPIFSPDYPRIFEDLITKHTFTQLVLTESVLKKVIDTVGLENLKYQVSKGYLEIFVIEEEVKVAFTVTNFFLSIGLFKPDGVYDTTLDLINTEERAVRWGIELFEYYQKKAKENDISNFCNG
ncbi:MAG: transcriptional regulator [Candidatus Methanophagaceae archaeon]|nr:MAG: transcriptional regulator [Methanophagales archaeon]